MEPTIVIVIDPEDQEFSHPADQVPDLPPVEPEQVPNSILQLNQPNHPLELPIEETNQPNQPNQPNLPPNKPTNLPTNPPDPMANQQQLNWSYFLT